MSEREPGGTAAWSLQCQGCSRFLDWVVPLRLNKQNEPCHYDLLARRLCGPVERVELRSDEKSR